MNETNTNQNNTQAPFELYNSLLKAQAEIPNPEKGAKGYGYKYATLDSIIKVIKPILAKHGLGLYQFPVGAIENDCVTIKTVLFHSNGQSLEEQSSIPVKFNSNPVQDYGASLTYGKRYQLLGLLNICPQDEDKDGELSKPVAKNNKPSSDAKKNPIRNAKLVDAADQRIANLAITDWAEGTGFTPHRTKEESLQRFLNLSDDDLFATVEKWRKEQAA
jgi:hypothetical protein